MGSLAQRPWPSHKVRKYSNFESGLGGTGSGGVVINVAQMVVREEADINKIAIELDRMTQIKDRTAGRIG